MDGPRGMHFVTHLVPKRWGLNALQSANHKDLQCTFEKSWGLKMLQSANYRDHPCTFEKLGTKSKIFVNHRDHPCTLLDYFLQILLLFFGLWLDVLICSGNYAFVTDDERALEEMYGDNAENSHQFEVSLNTMATRIATTFASLKEHPTVRYRVKGTSGSAETTFRDLVPQKLASAICEHINTYKTTIPKFPPTQTCELLIVDRSVDLVAPVIHEWTYDAMCHDLVDLDGNKYVMEVPSKSGGDPETKEFLLEDHDSVWLEMRHLHIADASEKLSDKMDNLRTKNKAAQLQQK
ncbi:putative sec1-like protein [Helianthus anomalus]